MQTLLARQQGIAHRVDASTDAPNLTHVFASSTLSRRVLSALAPSKLEIELGESVEFARFRFALFAATGAFFTVAGSCSDGRARGFFFA